MNPFSLNVPFGWLIERVLGLAALKRLYAERRAANFVSEALRILRIPVTTTGELASIPARGPVIVVANHPSGAIDGLALAHVVQSRRPDVKILANHLLLRIPELREYVIAVNPFDRRAPENRRALKAARRWLEAGGALVVFPAGSVSSVEIDGSAVDGVWQDGALKLAEWTGAAVVPVYIRNQARKWYRLAGRVHPLLRTALLARELLGRRGSSVGVAIGDAIGADRLTAFGDAAMRLAYLRARTYALQGASPHTSQTVVVEPVAGPEPQDRLAMDVARLPAEALLLSSGAYEVYVAPASALPNVIREIGRLREETFRLVNEGTGRARDLDAFDETYLHLFVWHTAERSVVGAYRLGATDRLFAATRPEALYTRSLFHFGPRLLRELGPALELGRSFVRKEFQRESNALLLLWRGIGAFVARHPHYRFLFGAVSISADYHTLTRQVIVRSLSSGPFLSHLSALVRPSRPLPSGDAASPLARPAIASSLDDVERLVTELEGGRGLPVLLRQYLKLNARLLGFSVDPSFGGVLDGLVLVDLLAVNPALLQRYLGRAGAAAVRRRHSDPATSTRTAA